MGCAEGGFWASKSPPLPGAQGRSAREFEFELVFSFPRTLHELEHFERDGKDERRSMIGRADLLGGLEEAELKRGIEQYSKSL